MAILTSGKAYDKGKATDPAYWDLCSEGEPQTINDTQPTEATADSVTTETEAAQDPADSVTSAQAGGQYSTDFDFAPEASQNAPKSHVMPDKVQEPYTDAKNATAREYAWLTTDIKGLDRTAIAGTCSPLIFSALSQGWHDAADIAQGHGQGIETDLYFSIVRRGQYILNPEPLKFRGLTILAARTSGGKTLHLTSIMAYLLTHLQGKRADQRRQLIARIRNGETVTRAEVDACKEIFAVFISLEEGTDDIYARSFAGYCEYTQREIDKRYYPNIEARTQPRPSTEQILQALSGIPVKSYSTNAANAEAVIERYQRRFDSNASIVSQDSLDRLRRIETERIKDVLREQGKDYDPKLHQPPRVVINDLDTLYEYIATTKEAIESANMQPVFFVDYVQRIHPSDGDQSYNANTYKQIQRVIESLTSLTAFGAIIFAAAQMNRDNSKEARNNRQYEFLNAICEDLREGADIEQGADMILYSQICDEDADGVTRLAVRTLKYRRGIREQATFATIHWDTKTAVYCNELFNVERIPKKSQMETVKTTTQAGTQAGATSANTATTADTTSTEDSETRDGDGIEVDGVQIDIITGAPIGKAPRNKSKANDKGKGGRRV